MFDTERFIAEIGKRPAIYDVNSEEYNDRSAKFNAWDEVCEIMIPKWRTLADEEKNIEEKILRGKWRNIRDYFMKELKIQKVRNKSSAGRKRKKYMYFDQLLFLMPNVENKQKYAVRRKHRENSMEQQFKNEETEQEVDSGTMMEEYELPLNHADIVDEYNSSSDEAYMAAAQFPKSICETSLAASAADEFPDIMSTNGSGSQRHLKPIDEDDYDRMFLLSLLPIMRRVPEDKKLDVRIQMQQALALAIRNNAPT